jgi:hypothetical protein
MPIDRADPSPPVKPEPPCAFPLESDRAYCATHDAWHRPEPRTSEASEAVKDAARRIHVWRGVMPGQHEPSLEAILFDLANAIRGEE